MIQFDAKTKTFNLTLKHSFYAFQINYENALVHLGWGIRPADAAPDDHLSGKLTEPVYSMVGFEMQSRRDELVTFGDVSQHEVALKVNFAQHPRGVAPTEAPHTPVRDVRLRYAGHEIVSDAQPGLAPAHGLPTAVTTPRETLRVRLADPVYPFAATLCYRLTPEHDIIERWCELENSGETPVSVEACAFASLHLPPATTELTTVSGTWAREFSTERVQLSQGVFTIESRALQTGHYFNPFFLLNQPGHATEESGAVYFGHLAYSGSWRLAFERLYSGAMRVHGGYNPFDFEMTLTPGETHATPAMVIGVSDAGRGGASRQLHAFARERILPRPPQNSDVRPVLYNSWEATYFDVTEAGQMALAEKAAAIGVELFCVDDGWFGGRRNDFAGLGDWVVSPDAFPNGLEPLITTVKKLGMKFGLWVEPEMVNPDSDLYRTHPDWVLHFPARPRTEARNQLMLDFGRPEVADYIFGLLDDLLTQYDISFIKWDMNRYASEPGSVVGKAIWRAHTVAVYDIMDRLRKNHPQVEIESCSGGGGRIDLGILARTDQVWTSDNTDAFDRIRIQEGFSLAYPAQAMEAWVTHTKNHQTGRTLALSTRFDVAMRGALGIGSDLNALDDAELKQYAKYIAFYKQFRHVVQHGNLYRLMLLPEQDASITLYTLPDGSEAVYSVVVRDHRLGNLRPTPPLRGLVSGAIYAATDVDGTEVLRASGYELMSLGIPGDAGWGVEYSRTLHLRRVD